MRRPAALLTAAALVLMLAGCGASDPAPGADHAADQAEDAYAPVPEPGRTIEATPPAEAVDVSGWRIAVVVPDGDTATQTLLSAVGESADRNGAHVEEFGGDVDVAFADALDADADVVIGLGEGTSDVFAYEASQWLDREFLILGAQAAEPTDNVTAVIWEGATSRGSGAPAALAIMSMSVSVSSRRVASPRSAESASSTRKASRPRELRMPSRQGSRAWRAA